jgi:hypothetical protein
MGKKLELREEVVGVVLGHIRLCGVYQGYFGRREGEDRELICG